MTARPGSASIDRPHALAVSYSLKEMIRMPTETLITTGTVKGNTILLEDHTSFPDGARVLVTVAAEGEDLAERERDFYERLEAQGLITIPDTPPEQVRRNEPITVTGKPLSQIIIEDRR